MLLFYAVEPNGPRRLPLGEGGALPAEAGWIDLLNPNPEEDRAVEALLGASVPTREEAEEIEFSSRFYTEGDSVVLTATVLAGIGQGKPHLTPLTFVLTPDRLATIRYQDFTALDQFLARAAKAQAPCGDPAGVFLSILEAIVDRLADVVEKLGAEIDRTTRKIFSRKREGNRKRRQLAGLIERIGSHDDLVGKARESLASLERLLQYAKAARRERLGRGDNGDRIDLMRHDVRSLSDQLGFLSGKTIFQLDATLGLISTEQNEVIRVLTVVATFFFPPTLVGTIYGMNFHFMPELGWWLGYPAALLLMVVSAILPFLYFRHRGWM